MKVTYKNYVLKEEAGRFNLIEMKEGELKEALKPNTIGYAFTLENAINRIASIELSNKFEVLTLKEFLKEYSNIKDELKNYLNI